MTLIRLIIGLARHIIGWFLLIVAFLFYRERFFAPQIPRDQMKAIEIELLFWWSVAMPFLIGIGLTLICWPQIRNLFSPTKNPKPPN